MIVLNQFIPGLSISDSGRLAAEKTSGEYRQRNVLDKNSEMVKLVREKKILVREELSSFMKQEDLQSIEEEFKVNEAEVMVPIFIEEEPAFLLILGEKLSGDMFSREDINLLNTIANQSAIAIKNARLYAELEERVEGRTVELAEANKQLYKEILERTRAEAALQSAHNELELRVEERTADLIEANKQLQMQIAERRKLEEQLLHAEKMKAIGTLTGGIAHEFNNILTTIIGYGELLQERGYEDETLNAYLEIIGKSAQRAANLTQSLLAFSRKQVITPQPVDLNNVVRGVEKLMSKLDIAENDSYRKRFNRYGGR
jgi:C4-dicarboxylate-specific signal transduction histidine kinase